MFKPRVDRISYGGAMIGQEEVQAVNKIIKSQGGRRWTIGPESVAMEEELAKKTGVKRSVLTNSGSSALLVGIAALHLPKGSKVIIPAVNFPTAFNSIIQNGLVPLVVDVDINTLNIDLLEVKKAMIKYNDISAVIAVDIAGNPVNLRLLRRLVGKKVKIILDNCLAKGTLIKTIKGDVPIENIKIGDLVMTRRGYKKVLRVINRGIKPVITKLGITATPDHPFITTKGEKELNVLKPSDILYVWNEILSCIEEVSTSVIQKQYNVIGEYTSTTEKNFYIDKSGKMLMEKYQLGILSTIKTIIHSITNYPTWKQSLQNNIQKYILSKKVDQILQKGTSKSQGLELQDGISQKKEKNFINSIINGYGRLEKKSQKNVQYVETNTKHIGQLSQSSVQSNVKVEAEVYDLEIEDAHEFLANNILVHNCDGYGTKLKGKFIDTFADISCVSFHAAHIVTMGEGGAVLTNDTKVADRATKIREWGRASGTDKIYKYPGFPIDYKERYVYEEIGYNLKPLELQCAMGRVQLKRLEGFVSKRMKNYLALRKVFDKYPQFTMVDSLVESFPCWFSFPLLCEGIEREKVMRVLEENNIECRTIFSGNILRHPAYKDIEVARVDKLDNADFVMKNGMFLSCHPSITADMIRFIDEVIGKIVND